MSTRFVLWSELEIRLFQPKLAENAFGPIALGKDTWKFADSAIGLFLWKGLFSGNWPQKPLAWLLLDQAVSFELAGI